MHMLKPIEGASREYEPDSRLVVNGSGFGSGWASWSELQKQR